MAFLFEENTQYSYNEGGPFGSIQASILIVNYSRRGPMVHPASRRSNEAFWLRGTVVHRASSFYAPIIQIGFSPIDMCSVCGLEYSQLYGFC